MSFVLFGTVSQCCDATSILDGIIYWWPILIWQSKRAHQSYNTSRRWPPFKSWNTFLHSTTTTGLIGSLAAYLSSDVENIDVDDALLLVMIMVMTIGEPDSLAYIINTSHTLWGSLWLCIFSMPRHAQHQNIIICNKGLSLYYVIRDRAVRGGGLPNLLQYNIGGSSKL